VDRGYFVKPLDDSPSHCDPSLNRVGSSSQRLTEGVRVGFGPSWKEEDCFRRTGRFKFARHFAAMIPLQFPFTEEKIRALKVGDEVAVSGVIYTGRDAVHKYLHEGGALPPEVKLRDGILYHCGPVMMKQPDGSYICTAAGPTTSIREEPYQWQVIRDHGVRAVIGKGGMGDMTLKACLDYGCVYLHAVGGAAQVLADCIKKVRNVYMLEQFGSPEAIWELEVENFPAVVTIDSHGNSLHREVFAASQAELQKSLGATAH
jgi:fumarate hydratase subunit beta